MTVLRTELSALLNKFSAENESDTPDFILAQYLMDSLRAFDIAVVSRDEWYGKKGLDEAEFLARKSK